MMVSRSRSILGCCLGLLPVGSSLFAQSLATVETVPVVSGIANPPILTDQPITDQLAPISPLVDAPPIPQYSGRVAPAPQMTRPANTAAQRSESDSGSSFFNQRSIPVPGQPARNLPPPGEEPLADEDAGILSCIPHSLLDGGITFEVIYTGETFRRARGGINRSRRSNYRSNLDVVCNVDFERMGLWDGGRLFIYGESLYGPILPVGEIQLASNIDSTISDTARPEFTTIAEYWYEQYLCDGAVHFKVGKQDANADFAYTDLGGDFINSSFGLPPNIPLPTFPSQALGFAGFLEASDACTFGFGVYDGTAADGPQGVRWGFDTLGDNGAILLAQAEFRPQLGYLDQHPATLRCGGWYHTDDKQWEPLNPAKGNVDSNYGGWASVDYLLFKESYAEDNEQGLGVFLQGSWCPEDRNQISYAVIGGLVYNGLLPGRDQDLIGAGCGLARIGDEFLQAELANGNEFDSREIVTELFYKYQLSPFVILQPDLQFFTAPGTEYPDAFLLGLRFEAVL